MRTIDYGIATLNDGDLYNLLPTTVRSRDGGAVQALVRLLEYRHNEFIDLYRQLPRLQDPTKAGVFNPTDFNEDASLFAQWKQLRERLSPLSTQEQALLDHLADLVPVSVRAQSWEQQALRELAEACGDTLPQGPFSGYWRDFVASATLRHRLRGTHSGLYLLGAVLGIVDIKLTELWTSYELKQPETPQQTGQSRLVLTPDEYPLWDQVAMLLERGTELSSVAAYETPQVPIGTAGYSPLIQDDGGSTVTATFPRCSPLPSSPYSFRNVVNHNNPFGNFIGEVRGVITPGVYPSTTDSVGRGVIQIPYLSLVGSAVFQLSEHLSLPVVATVTGNTLQTLSLTGPTSRIRFKSSRYNISYTVDPAELSRFYLPQTVTPVQDSTPDDSSIGRAIPGLPVTGSLSGARTIASADLQVLSLTGLNETAGVARTLAQSQLPMTREVNEELFGVAFRDLVRYAPYQPITSVVLSDSSSQNWLLLVDQSGAVSWNRTDLPATQVPVQDDNGTMVAWGVSVAGNFVALATKLNRNDVVFLSSDAFAGYVYLDHGGLFSSRTQGEFITDVLHGDGTPDEQNLKLAYQNIVENPPEHLRNVMSDDAFAVVQDSGVLFQTRPEDSIKASPLLRDRVPSGLAANLIPGDEGFSAERSMGSLTGRTACTDIRNRYVGIEATLIQPVPTGDAGRDDGLTYDYPIGFLTYHGSWYWRDRQTNAAYKSYYLYESASPTCGATLVTEALSGDGPVEGSHTPAAGDYAEVSSTGFRATPNSQVTNRDLTVEWRRELLQTAARLKTTASIGNQGGHASIAALANEPVGTLFTVVSQSGDYSASGAFHLGNGALDLTFTAPEDVEIYRRRGELELSSETQVTLNIRSTDTIRTSWRIGYTNSSGQHMLRFGQVVPGNQYEAIFSLPSGSYSAWVDTSGGQHQLSMHINVPTGTLPTWPELAGQQLMGGGERDAIEVTIVDPGERYYDYGDGRSSLDPLLSGKKWFRGGDWQGGSPDQSSSSSSSQSSASSISSVGFSSSSSYSSESSSSSSQNSSSSSSSQYDFLLLGGSLLTLGDNSTPLRLYAEPESSSSSSSSQSSASSNSSSSSSSPSSASSASSDSSSSSSSPSSASSNSSSSSSSQSSASSNSSSSSSSPSSASSASSDSSSSSSSHPLTSYLNTLGSGNRTGLVTTSTNTINGGDASSLVDGNTASGGGLLLTLGSPAYIQFDFGSARWINQVRWVQSSTASSGTWRWEGSNNASTWSVLSSNFTLGGATTQLHDLTIWQDAFRYYRIIQVSGSITSTTIREVEFKIDSTGVDYSSSSSSSSP